MNIKQKDLRKIQTASYEQKKAIMDAMPLKCLSWLYVTYFTQQQLNDVFQEWHEILTIDKRAEELGDIEKIRQKYNKKMLSLIHGLKKARQTIRIPHNIRELYS